MFNWISVIVGIGYIALGIAVMVYKFFGIPLEPNTAYMLGGLIIAYGIFRFIRTLYKIKTDREDEKGH